MFCLCGVRQLSIAGIELLPEPFLPSLYTFNDHWISKCIYLESEFYIFPKTFKFCCNILLSKLIYIYVFRASTTFLISLSVTYPLCTSVLFQTVEMICSFFTLSARVNTLLFSNLWKDTRTVNGPVEVMSHDHVFGGCGSSGVWGVKIRWVKH